MSAPSVVGIWNRALQLLGASRVQSISDTTKNAIACTTCYEATRDKLYEMHVWRFCIKLAELAADSPEPDWGRANSFTLPTDYMMLAPDYPEDNFLDKDFEIQNGKIFTDQDAPLYIRYVAQITDPVQMTPTFRELLSTEMAVAMCEELTQSNTKKMNLSTGPDSPLERAWAAARRANGRQMRSQDPPEDPYITARR